MNEADDIMTFASASPDATESAINKVIVNMVATLFKTVLEPGELPSHLSNVCCVLAIPVISDVSTMRFYVKKAIKTTRRLTRKSNTAD